MRNRWILIFAWLAAVCVVCPRLLAQFQEPTQAELKMTADPMAPGADAVYLSMSEIAATDHVEIVLKAGQPAAGQPAAGGQGTGK